MLADPAREIARIADYVNLRPEPDRFAASLASIRSNTPPSPGAGRRAAED
jgi:hypothetical protein